MKILNLDAFVPEDKKFVLKGQEYSIPGDLDMEKWLKLMKHSQDESSGDVGAIEKAFETLADIIKIKNPEMTKEKLSTMLSMRQYMELTKHIFKSETETIKESGVIEEKKTNLTGDSNNAQ